MPTDFFAIRSGIVGAIMADNNDDLAADRSFRATITPHRSLGSVGFLVLMIVFGGVVVFAGMRLPDDGRLAGVRFFRSRRPDPVLGVSR